MAYANLSICISWELADLLIESAIIHKIYNKFIRVKHSPTHAVWYIEANEIYFIHSLRNSPELEDDLARQLAIIPTIEARLIYLKEFRNAD